MDFKKKKFILKQYLVLEVFSTYSLISMNKILSFVWFCFSRQSPAM